ncbi:MAG: hypothetical protein EB060_11480, partial [Proteobacteria bacterium]|nr:hypothetical protein [Pseudomonadota bacterium]
MRHNLHFLTFGSFELCIRAWTGFAPARNAVEVAVEFSSQPLHVKCDNETVRKFFTEWLRAAQIPQLTRQYFRGYYREGSVFTYTSYGQFGTPYYTNFQNAFGAKENRVPIRYEILNPANVFVPTGLSFPYTYVRMLSTWECERLRNPVTPQDKQVYEDLPKEAKLQIKNGQGNPEGIYLNLEPERLRFSFYKKQNWEPLGVPMLWPVLPSIEWKLALTKMDKALARTIDHAILLVTNGEPPSKENGGNGINQNNIARLQALLSNQTIGRVLVADYSTKAQWLVPPIQEILGPQKYEVVNRDIQEGLQSILTGDDKFANAQIKAKIFIQRLEEGQRCFLDDFLLPEVQNICKTMGFRTVPSIAFQKIDLQDESTMARIVTQLGQIGILTGPQVVKAIETQELPTKSEMESGQLEWKKQREDGLYEPLIGGQKDDGTAAGPNGRPAGTGVKQSGTRKSSPIGTKAAVDIGELAREAAFSTKTYTECLRESGAVVAAVDSALRKRHKIKGEFNDAQQRVADALVLKVVSTQPREKWVTSVASVLDAPPVVSNEVAEELDAISTEYQVDALDAA